MRGVTLFVGPAKAVAALGLCLVAAGCGGRRVSVDPSISDRPPAAPEPALEMARVSPCDDTLERTTIVSSPELEAYGLAVLDGFVYFGARHLHHRPTLGALYRVPVTGGDASSLGLPHEYLAGPVFARPGLLAFHAVRNHSGAISYDHLVIRSLDDGHEVTLTTAGQYWAGTAAAAMDSDGNIYFEHYDAVARQPQLGMWLRASGDEVLLHQGDDPIGRLFAVNGAVASYYMASSGDGPAGGVLALHRGGSMTTLWHAAEFHSAQGMGSDGEHVYLYDRARRHIVSIPVRGAAPATIAEDVDVGAAVVGRDNLYWDADGTIFFVSKRGGTPRRLFVTGGARAWALALDECACYASVTDPWAIVRYPKPR